MACRAFLAGWAATAFSGVSALQLPAAAHLPSDPFLQPISKFPVRSDDVERPLMLAMRGCSGSTAVDEIGRKLLRLHGINVAAAAKPEWVDGKPVAPTGDGWPSELLKPEVNWFYDKAGGDIAKAMQLANEMALQNKQTLFFKGMIHELASDDLFVQYEPFLRKYGPKTVMAYRFNQLDEIVCQVKDCFNPNYGFPVDASTGNESNLCFERREATSLAATRKNVGLAALDDSAKFYSQLGSDYKANMNAAHLVWAIKNEYALYNATRVKLESAGLKWDEVTSEDLLDFQTDLKDGVERGTDAWCKLLTSLGVDADRNRIHDFLQLSQGSYAAAPPHSELIYNIDEVRETLKKSHFDYAKFLRD